MSEYVPDDNEAALLLDSVDAEIDVTRKATMVDLLGRYRDAKAVAGQKPFEVDTSVARKSREQMESMFDGLDKVDANLEPAQRAQFNSAVEASADRDEAKARMVNQAWAVAQWPKLTDAVDADWTTVKHHIAKEVFGSDATEIPDTAFYGQIGAHVKKQKAEREMLTDVLTKVQVEAAQGTGDWLAAWKKAGSGISSNPGWNPNNQDRYRQAAQKVFAETQESTKGMRAAISAGQEYYKLATTGSTGTKSPTGEVVPKTSEEMRAESDKLSAARRTFVDELVRLPQGEQEQALSLAVAGAANVAPKLKAEEGAAGFAEKTAESLERSIGAFPRSVGRFAMQSVRSASELTQLLRVANYGESPEGPGGMYAEQQAMRVSDLERKVDAGLTDAVDPIKSKNRLAQGVYDTMQSLPYMVAAGAAPEIGIPLTLLAMAEDNRAKFVDAGVPPQEAATLALAAAAPQVAIERLQANMVFHGKLPGVEKWLTKAVGSKLELAGKMLAVGGIETVHENVEEALQDITTPVVQEVGSWLSDAVPDVNWKKELSAYSGERVDTFFALLPLVLLGTGTASFKEASYGRQYLAQKTILKAAGFTEQAAEEISQLAARGEVEKAQNLVQTGWEDPEVRPRAEIEKETKEAKADVESVGKFNTEEQREAFDQLDADMKASWNEQANPGGARAVRNEDGTWSVMDRQGVLVDVTSTPEHAVELVREVDQADSANLTAILDDAIAYFKERGRGGKIEQTQDVRTLEDVVDSGAMTGEDAQRVVDLYISLGSLPAGTTPREARIYGENVRVYDAKRKVYEYVSRLHHGADPLVLIEEEAEGYFKQEVDAGRITLDEVEEWRKAVEGVGFGAKDGTARGREANEWFSTHAKAYLTGKIQSDGAVAAKIPLSIRRWLDKVRQVFAEVFKLARDLIELEKAGKLPEGLQKHLARAVGLDEAFLEQRAREGEREEANRDKPPEILEWIRGQLPHPNDYEGPLSGELRDLYDSMAKRVKVEERGVDRIEDGELKRARKGYEATNLSEANAFFAKEGTATNIDRVWEAAREAGFMFTDEADMLLAVSNSVKGIPSYASPRELTEEEWKAQTHALRKAPKTDKTVDMFSSDDLPFNLAGEEVKDTEGAVDQEEARRDAVKKQKDAQEEMTFSLRKQTETPEFAAWFGDSKVVDAEGKPLVVYHGTKSDVVVFDRKKAGASDPGLVGKAFYFTPVPESASSFAESRFYGRGEQPNVVPAFLSIQNPFQINDGVLPDGRGLTQVYPQGIQKVTAAQLQRSIQQAGHDGVIFKVSGEITQVVAFDPTQIKSATGNRGTFDASNPDITFALRRAVPADASNQTELPDGSRLVGPTTFSIRAYHGTPHKVDKFSTEKIGTGEGAQVYGWGLYFAEEPAVAKQYREALAGKPKRQEITIDGIPASQWDYSKLSMEERRGLYEIQEQQSFLNPDNVDIIARLKNQLPNTLAGYEQTQAEGRVASSSGMASSDEQRVKDLRGAIRWLESGRIGIERGKEPGHVYTVDLLPEPEHFLDWDTPLQEQGEKVKEALAQVYRDARARYSENPDDHKAIDLVAQARINAQTADLSGEQVYRGLSSVVGADKKKATEILAAAGVPGIRYLDQGSRRDVAKYMQFLSTGEWYAIDGEARGLGKFQTEQEAKDVVDKWNAENPMTYNYVIFDDKLVKILEENGKPVEQGQSTYSLRRAPFYSRLTRTVEESKQEKANGAQWKATIRNSKIGVNKGEYDLVGVDDLEDGKSYTKAEVLDYLKANEVKVEDVTLGGDREATIDAERRLAAAGYTVEYDHGDESVYIVDANDDPVEIDEMPEELQIDARAVATEQRPASFEQYSLPGAKEGSYREVLLTVPDQSLGVPTHGGIEQLQNGKFRVYAPGLQDVLYDTWAEAVKETERLGRVFPHLAQRSLKKLPPGFRMEDRGEGVYPRFVVLGPANGPVNRYASGSTEQQALEKFTRFHRAGWEDGHSQYSEIENPIVRLRYNERTTADGQRMFFLEEVQAPQKGNFEQMPELFQKNWREIGFKWALRKAVEGEFDSLGWTTGEIQAERYDLSKQVSRVVLQKNPHGEPFLQAFDHDGRRVVDKAVREDELDSYIGKDAAKKMAEMSWKPYSHETSNGGLITQEHKILEGLDLKVGGHGLTQLYDQDFRNVVNGLPAVKRSGQKAGMAGIGNSDMGKLLEIDAWAKSSEERRLPSAIKREFGEDWSRKYSQYVSQSRDVTKPEYAVHSLTITPSMRDSVEGGQATFSLRRQTARPAFKRWFGDSKVVDSVGEPLVVYHGTNQNFSRFDRERLGKNTGNVATKGFFFTESTDEANEYAKFSAKRQIADAVNVEKRVEELKREMARAERRGDWDRVEALTTEWEDLELGGIRDEVSGASVVPVFLSIQNPMVKDVENTINTHDLARLIDEAKAAGHDGMKLLNVYDPVSDRPGAFSTTQWIAFAPTQIKSAIGNRGTFDKSNPDITFSLRPDGGKMRLLDLPRDMREDLFNNHAMFVDPEARETRFYLNRVPTGEVDISDLLVSKMRDEEVTPYVEADPRKMPPIVVADGRLIDGQHRILAARRLGIPTLRYIDMTGLFDTKESGYISEIPKAVANPDITFSLGVFEKAHWIGPNGEKRTGSNHQPIADAITGKEGDESYEEMFRRGWARVVEDRGAIYYNTYLNGPELPLKKGAKQGLEDLSFETRKRVLDLRRNFADFGFGTFSIGPADRADKVQDAMKSRRIGQRVQASTVFADEVKALVGQPQYAVRGMDVNEREAKRIIEENNGDLAKLMTILVNPTQTMHPATKVALAFFMAEAANKAGDYPAAAIIAIQAAEDATSAGQSVNELKRWSVFTQPETCQQLLQTQIDRENTKRKDQQPIIQATVDTFAEVQKEARKLLRQWLDEINGIADKKPDELVAVDVSSFPEVTFSLSAEQKASGIVQVVAKMLKESGADATEKALVERYGTQVEKHIPDLFIEAQKSLTKKTGKADKKFKTRQPNLPEDRIEATLAQGRGKVEDQLTMPTAEELKAQGMSDEEIEQTLAQLRGRAEQQGELIPGEDKTPRLSDEEIEKTLSEQRAFGSGAQSLADIPELFDRFLEHVFQSIKARGEAENISVPRGTRDQIADILNRHGLQASKDDVKRIIGARQLLPNMTPAQAEELAEFAKRIASTPLESFERGQQTMELFSYVHDQLAPYDIVDVAFGLWYANVLSSLITSARNVTGNASMLFLDQATETIFRNPRLYWPYLEQMWEAAKTGLEGGAAQASNTAKTGQEGLHRSVSLGDERRQGVLESKTAPLKGLRSISRLATRFLSIQDLFFANTAFEMKARQIAWDQARKEAASGKIKPEAVAERVANLLNESTDQIQTFRDRAAVEWENLHPEIQAQYERASWEKRRVKELQLFEREKQLVSRALDFAQKVTLDFEPEGLLGAVMTNLARVFTVLEKGAQDVQNKPVRLLTKAAAKYARTRIIPFMRVPVNVFNRALDYGPVGYGRALMDAAGIPVLQGSKTRVRSAEERADLLKRATLGTLAMLPLAILTRPPDPDDEPEENPWLQIHGAGSGNPHTNIALNGPKYRPYSFEMRVGGKQVFMDYRLFPLAPYLATIGSLHDRTRYKKDISEKSAMVQGWILAQAMKEAFMSSSPITSLRELSEAAAENQPLSERAMNRTLARGSVGVVSNLIPFSGLWRSLDQLAGGDRNTRDTLLAASMAELPVAGRFNKPSIDVLGDPMTNRGGIGWIADWTTMATPESRIYRAFAEKDVTPTDISRYQTARVKLVGEPEKRTLTVEEYYDFAKARGAELKAALLSADDDGKTGLDHLMGLSQEPPSKDAESPAKRYLDRLSRAATRRALVKMKMEAVAEAKEEK